MDGQVIAPLRGSYNTSRREVGLDGWICFHAIGIRRRMTHAVNEIAANASGAFPHLELVTLDHCAERNGQRRVHEVVFREAPFDRGRLVEYAWGVDGACLGVIFAWKEGGPRTIHVELLAKPRQPLKRAFFQDLANKYHTLAADMQ